MGERLLRVAVPHGTPIAALWDPSSAAMARLAGLGPAAGSAAEVIAASDAVYVASPPSSHIEHGRAALAAGKALLLEKPLASDTEAARGFVAWAAGKPAAVNFPMASSPAVARLREWLSGIGAVQRCDIAVAFREWPREWQKAAASWLSLRAEGGFTREVVSHFLFLAGRVLGPLEIVEAQAGFPDAARAETSLRASLRAGAVPVSLTGDVGTTDREDTNLFTLVGERGSIRLRDWSIAERQRADGGWEPDPDAVPNPQMRPVTLGGQLDKLARLAAGERDTGLATLEEALAVQELVEAMLAG
ncbi:MAG: Gfo/Idh/MocA family oxidoreductase [Acetobacteraceae bacterium]|nr:Gfo/Idh/MocA family oxidoreductase [Acetobacteraceae bacterium]